MEHRVICFILESAVLPDMNRASSAASTCREAFECCHIGNFSCNFTRAGLIGEARHALADDRRSAIGSAVLLAAVREHSPRVSWRIRAKAVQFTGDDR